MPKYNNTPEGTTTTSSVLENVQVYGITHLVYLQDGSLYNQNYKSNEYLQVYDEDIVEIESNTILLSRRGPNQEQFGYVDLNGPQHYVWYLVRKVNGQTVYPDVFIREDTFHRINVKPTAETIGQFFKWFRGGVTPDLALLSVDAVKLNDNREKYLKEFTDRLIALKPGIQDQVIGSLFNDLIEIFMQKDIALAKKFLLNLNAEAGLEPLELESERLYWSGKESRKKAYDTSAPGSTALEKTEIGQLLDKFSFFEAIPWDLSTILWAEVSRSFSVGARGTMNVYIDGGFAKGNVFWNDELPALRLMQNYRLVTNITIHLWHTKKQRWVKEFDIQSEKLKMVFDKAKRIPNPTPEKPDNTKSYRYPTPIDVSYLRRILIQYLQSLNREKPLVFYAFRLKTGVFASTRRTDYGMEVSFFNFGSQAKKIAHIEARDTDLKRTIEKAEAYLLKNCTDYESIPRGLVFTIDKIFSTYRPLIIA